MNLAQFVKNLDRSYENVISFELECMENIVFVGCYIPPDDSPYYDTAIFGHVQSLVKNGGGKTFFVMGDLNSRVGTPKNKDSKDIRVNRNGRRLLELCDETKLIIQRETFFIEPFLPQEVYMDIGTR